MTCDRIRSEAGVQQVAGRPLVVKTTGLFWQWTKTTGLRKHFNLLLQESMAWPFSWRENHWPASSGLNGQTRFDSKAVYGLGTLTHLMATRPVLLAENTQQPSTDRHRVPTTLYLVSQKTSFSAAFSPLTIFIRQIHYTLSLFSFFGQRFMERNLDDPKRH